MASENTRLHFDIFGSAPIAYGPLLLYQVGDCYAKEGFQVHNHVQWCEEISYVVSGEAVFVVNGVEYPVRTGDLIVSPKDSSHRIVSVSENPVRYFYLGYSLVQTHPEYDRWRTMVQKLSRLENPVCHNAEQMVHLFSNVLCEFQQHFEEKHLIITLALQQILLYTYKYFFYHPEAAVYDKRLPDKQELVHEIISYMDSNVLQIKSLTDVSRYIGFSYSYTAQLFSSVMHMSLNQYYQKRRFEEAAKLLKSGLGVTQTAELLGFDSVHSFSRAFKSRYQMSPQSYIRCCTESRDF